MAEKQIAAKDKEWRTPPADIVEQQDAYRIVLDMPGVEERNLEVTFQNGSLVITGKVAPGEHGRVQAARREYEPYDFRREFSLSDQHVDVDKISAALRDGELILTLPKSEAIKPRRIEVKTV